MPSNFAIIVARVRSMVMEHPFDGSNCDNDNSGGEVNRFNPQPETRLCEANKATATNEKHIPITMSTISPRKFVLTSIPPTFFLPSVSSARTAYRSLGHLRRTSLPHAPSTASSLQASVTARPKRYCTKTSLEAGMEESDTRRRRENWRQPGGESHTLVPRPRPESW
jgi:hypothetical protein